jgi:hypothetical protein
VGGEALGRWTELAQRCPHSLSVGSFSGEAANEESDSPSSCSCSGETPAGLAAPGTKALAAASNASKSNLVACRRGGKTKGRAHTESKAVAGEDESGDCRETKGEHGFSGWTAGTSPQCVAVTHRVHAGVLDDHPARVYHRVMRHCFQSPLGLDRLLHLCRTRAWGESYVEAGRWRWHAAAHQA